MIKNITLLYQHKCIAIEKVDGKQETLTFDILCERFSTKDYPTNITWDGGNDLMIHYGKNARVLDLSNRF